MWTEQLASGRHRGVYRDRDGRKRTRTFDFEYEARAWAIQAEGEALQPTDAELQASHDSYVEDMLDQDDRPALTLVAGGRCKLHPAFEADYCPTCGTAQLVGQQPDPKA